MPYNCVYTSCKGLCRFIDWKNSRNLYAVLCSTELLNKEKAWFIVCMSWYHCLLNSATWHCNMIICIWFLYTYLSLTERFWLIYFLNTDILMFLVTRSQNKLRNICCCLTATRDISDWRERNDVSSNTWASG